MYDLKLTFSHVPAQDDLQIRDITIGGLLRETAAKTPDAPALLEVTQAGQIGRSWTYTELLEASERLALALASRFE